MTHIKHTVVEEIPAAIYPDSPVEDLRGRLSGRELLLMLVRGHDSLGVRQVIGQVRWGTFHKKDGSLDRRNAPQSLPVERWRISRV